MKQSNWELFFKEEAPQYLDNCFTKNTDFEVAFIIEELDLKQNERILDLGCGTCRHSLELAKKGYRMTGIDLSKDQLAIAETKMKEEGVTINLINGDASEIVLDEEFDHVICLCEGAFCLYEEGNNPIVYHQSILRNIYTMLKTGGILILNALNAFRMIRQFSDEDVRKGIFDPFTLSEIYEYTISSGKTITLMEKSFLPHELKQMLEGIGFEVLNIWGGTAGAWNRKPLQLDEMEMMVISQKVSGKAIFL